MDLFDIKILRVLQKDGRASFQSVGEQVGLSLSACHKRTRALEDQGIIEGYRAIVSEEKIGFGASVYVTVSLADQADETLARFERAVVKRDEVQECVLMSGKSDYLLRVICDGLGGYEKLHRDFLTSLPGVSSVTSSFALRTVCRRSHVPLQDN